MNKLSKNEKGFTLVEALLIILILVVICGVGYMVYHNHHKANATLLNKPTTSTATKTTTATNPYEGWKSYCDSINSYCFKYPSNWQLADKSSSGQTYVTITDPSNTTAVYYNNPYSGDGIPASPFYTSLIYPLAGSNSNLAVIGGYWTTQSNILEQPFYQVVDSSYLKANPLVVGKVGQLSSNRFTDTSNTSNSGSMTLGAVANNGQFLASQVSTWLNAQDTRTGLQILKSLASD